MYTQRLRARPRPSFAAAAAAGGLARVSASAGHAAVPALAAAAFYASSLLVRCARRLPLAACRRGNEAQPRRAPGRRRRLVTPCRNPVARQSSQRRPPASPSAAADRTRVAPTPAHTAAVLRALAASGPAASHGSARPGETAGALRILRMAVATGACPRNSKQQIPNTKYRHRAPPRHRTRTATEGAPAPHQRRARCTALPVSNPRQPTR
jgi:hypothetical protein